MNTFCGLCIRSFCDGWGSFFGGVAPFGGHARSVNPILGAGIPDWGLVVFFGLKVAVTASSDAFLDTTFFGCVVRATIGEFSLRRGEPNLSGDPSRSSGPRRSGDPSRCGDPNRSGNPDSCGDAEDCGEFLLSWPNVNLVGEGVLGKVLANCCC